MEEGRQISRPYDIIPISLVSLRPIDSLLGFPIRDSQSQKSVRDPYRLYLYVEINFASWVNRRFVRQPCVGVGLQ